MNTVVIRQGFIGLSVSCVLALASATPVWAAGGGGAAMPWNAPLQNLLDNLSGPTAQTLGMLMFVVGALMWGFSRNEEHIRRFGPSTGPGMPMAGVAPSRRQPCPGRLPGARAAARVVPRLRARGPGPNLISP